MMSPNRNMAARTVLQLKTRVTLPNVPEEVFSLWLDGFARLKGWNPLSRTWFDLFGKRSLFEWQNFVWDKQELRLADESFTQRTVEIIEDLKRATFFDERNRFSRIQNSKSRAIRSLHYIEKNLTLPSVLIFVSETGSLDIIDGCHRLAAYSFFRSKMPDVASKVVCTAWIASLRSFLESEEAALTMLELIKTRPKSE